jgi:hypothetical protein
MIDDLIQKKPNGMMRGGNTPGSKSFVFFENTPDRMWPVLSRFLEKYFHIRGVGKYASKYF